MDVYINICYKNISDKVKLITEMHRPQKVGL